METLTYCSICNTQLPVNPYITAMDYLVTGKKFNIVECEECGFLLTNPRPDPEEIQKYYQSEAYISHTDTSSSFDEFLYHLVKRFMLKRKTGLLKKHTTHNRAKLLDFGCGTGAFLQVAINAGFEAEGFEPGVVAQTAAKDKELTIISDADTLFKNQTKVYDIISLWHVMEHIHEFPSILNNFNTLLSEKGLLIVAVPIANSADAKHYKQHWAAYDLPRHLYHFTRKTLTRACQNAGFNLIDKQPMVFDSFYVSLLSEKHKGSKLQLLKAFYQGSVSNTKAIFKKSPWSSEIFVFKKC